MKVKFYIVCILMLLILIGCGKNTAWKFDTKYTRYLTVMAPEYEEMTGSRSADTVDTLRIYKIKSKHYRWYNLSELSRKSLVYETNDKINIRKFVYAAQEFTKNVKSIKNDTINDNIDKYHVVLFDNASMQYGYFIFTRKSNVQEYAEILIPDESGCGPMFYYNKCIISVLKDVMANTFK